jgi:hypothetical protein
MRMQRRPSQSVAHPPKRARFEEHESEEELDKSEEDESSQDDSEGDSEDDSEDDSENNSDEEVENVAPARKLAIEQRLLAESRELGTQLKQDRARAAREDGLETATEHLNKVNATFAESMKYKIDSKTVQLYDTRNFVGSSDLVDIAVRNIKIGSTDKIIKDEELYRRFKLFLLRTSMRHDFEASDDPEQYIEQKHEFKKFNWFSVGTFAYSRARKPMICDHLLGPLKIEKKVREVKRREKFRATGPITTAEEVRGEDVNNKATDHTTLAVQNAFRVFQRKAGGDAINIFKFFINPHSFSQSVENMFYTSFLLKDGRLRLGEDEDGYPTISLPPALPDDAKLAEKERLRRADLPSNHLIFQLEYGSWKKLIEKFGITESFITDRDPQVV